MGNFHQKIRDAAIQDLEAALISNQIQNQK
jgi:hypothetical protein